MLDSICSLLAGRCVIFTQIRAMPCRYNGQLWIPLPGTYTFKLSATNNAALFVGNNKILNSTG